MTPEEFIRMNVDIKMAGIAHMVDSHFIKDLMNRYANYRVDEAIKEEREKQKQK